MDARTRFVSRRRLAVADLRRIGGLLLELRAAIIAGEVHPSWPVCICRVSNEAAADAIDRKLYLEPWRKRRALKSKQNRSKSK